ncbi:MAG: hypothetical protein Q9O74_12250 [Planctomycetota bacterium]|nr:hypothetical protein [Planctomycetota bacterium]
MYRQLFGAWIIAAAALALPANADIMHWYWQVEVNGQTADASKLIVVGAGDEVEIELWAEWEPQGEGIATAVFSISVGDQFFEVASSVDISEENGFGRNPTLSNESTASGTFLDTDGSDMYDLIDWIDVGQLPRFFGQEFDDSNPLPVYSLLWVVDRPIEVPIVVQRADIVQWGFARYQQVYLDEWGNGKNYDHSEDRLVFVPAPGNAIIILSILVPWRRRHR